MRQNIKIPRILKINWVRDLAISVVFNNGESRIIDFRKLLKHINVTEKSPAYILNKSEELSKVELEENTLSWSNVEQFITGRDGKKIAVPFQIGADVLLKYSHPEKTELSLKIGRMVKEARIKMGLTQQELALRSGTSRTYISRIENDKSDMELSTLVKIIELGLGRKFEIVMK